VTSDDLLSVQLRITCGPRTTFSHEDDAFRFVADAGGGGGGGGGCGRVVVVGGGF
jgi:hypothetical protein